MFRFEKQSRRKLQRPQPVSIWKDFGKMTYESEPPEPLNPTFLSARTISTTLLFLRSERDENKCVTTELLETVCPYG